MVTGKDKISSLAYAEDLILLSLDKTRYSRKARTREVVVISRMRMGVLLEKRIIEIILDVEKMKNDKMEKKGEQKRI